ncbi:MAG: nuclear transport factor 2 family protein [bacterium]|nr:nuclear transport factor 2 family protein [bacterium]
MDSIDQWLAIEAIKQLKARYFRLMDTKDWAGLRDLFCNDAIFDARASLSVAADGQDDAWLHSGGDQICAFIQSAVGANITVHHGHCHEVTLIDPMQASGIIAMEDQIWEPDGKTPFLHGAGHYHEIYHKLDGAWRIHRTRITRLYVKVG